HDIGIAGAGILSPLLRLLGSVVVVSAILIASLLTGGGPRAGDGAASLALALALLHARIHCRLDDLRNDIGFGVLQLHKLGNERRIINGVIDDGSHPDQLTHDGAGFGDEEPAGMDHRSDTAEFVENNM